MKIRPPSPRLWLEPALAGLVFIIAYGCAFHFFWPLVFVTVVPLTWLACRGSRAWPRVLGAGLAGWLAFGTMQFFFTVISPPSLVALAAVQGASLIPVALATRWLREVTRWPWALILPVTWVGGEHLRAQGDMGLPNGALAWLAWDQLWMIQVCDLAGTAGLGFALAMVNGALADFLWWQAEARAEDSMHPKAFWRPNAWPGRIKAVFLGTFALWVLLAGYGAWRLREARATMRPGPVVSVIQPDVPYAGGVLQGFDPRLHDDQMFAWSEAALAQKPGLIVWPEGLATVPPLNPEFLGPAVRPRVPAHRELQQYGRELDTRLHSWASSNGVSLIMGSPAWKPDPAGEAGAWQLFNSANIYPRSPGKPPESQLKIRLFPGGEFMPWQGALLNRELRRLGGQAVLAVERETGRGTARKVFQLASHPGDGARPARYVISVCSEILFPDSSAAFLDSGSGEKPFDFLVNPSNDGLFQRSCALRFQFRNLAFRAVETRVGIAASCNTGISGFAKPTGELYGEVRNSTGQAWTGRGARELPLIAQVVAFRASHSDAEILAFPALYAQLTNTQARIEQLRAESGVSGHSTQTVFLDSRRTFYSRHGDWLGIGSMWIMLGAATLALTGIGTTRPGRGQVSRDGK